MYLREWIEGSGFIQQELLNTWYKHSCALGVAENYSITCAYKPLK